MLRPGDLKLQVPGARCQTRVALSGPSCKLTAAAVVRKKRTTWKCRVAVKFEGNYPMMWFSGKKVEFGIGSKM